MVPRNVAHVPSSDTLAVGSKGKVRTTNSTTSNETSPPQSHSLLALLEGPDRTTPASAIELTFALNSSERGIDPALSAGDASSPKSAHRRLPPLRGPR